MKEDLGATLLILDQAVWPTTNDQREPFLKFSTQMKTTIIS
jgi:hypothetical protein